MVGQFKSLYLIRKIPRLLLGVVASYLLSNSIVFASVADSFNETAKIVVIGGALTEIVHELGEEHRMIGRDLTSTYPESVKKLPSVGYMRQLSPEGVISLSPDGILMVEGSGPQSTLDVLNQSSIPVVTIPEGYDEAGVISKIRLVGHALHKEAAAENLVTNVAAKFAHTAAIVSRIKNKKRVLFILGIQSGRLMAGGKDTAADGIITLAGGINAINQFSGYKLLDAEAIEASAPDMILMMSNVGPVDAGEQILNMPVVKLTPAGRARALFKLDGLYLLGFGPRTADAAYEVCKALYPHLTQ